MKRGSNTRRGGESQGDAVILCSEGSSNVGRGLEPEPEAEEVGGKNRGERRTELIEAEITGLVGEKYKV